MDLFVPVDISPRPVLSAIVTQLFPPRDYFKSMIAKILDDQSSAMSSLDMITISAGDRS
jgi:hypothetical protein